jgi:hypothetical protein
VKAKSLDNYQEIKNLVIEKELNLEDDSLLCKAISNKFKILEFINYFLEKRKGLKNSDALIKKLLQVGLKGCEKFVSNDYKDWYTVLFELETFYLLSNKLGLNVIGYEQPPVGITKPPDFEIKLNNEIIYFEAKFKAREVIQKVPPKFYDFLDKIEEEYGNKYGITLVETENVEDKQRKPNYQKLFSKYLLLPENLKLIEQKIRERLDVLKRSNILEQQNRHSPPCIFPIKAGKENINIHFLIVLRQTSSASKRLQGFMNDEIDDIKSWLFEKKEGKTPMIKEAESKGADYLVACFPFWRNLYETFVDYVKPLFSDIQLLKPTFAISKDKNLGQLSGIILLSQKGALTDNYLIVNNANVTPKIKDWIGNVCFS